MAATDITSLLLKNQCHCLNEDLRAPHTNLFIGDHTLPLRSDTDEQLILHLAYNQTMKLSKIIVGVPNNDSCPKTLKLFCNSINLGFSDAAEMKAIQTIEISPGQSLVTIDLQANKWNRADSITIFVEDNHGSDVSELHSVKVGLLTSLP
jgi:hypothetical protein